MIKKIEICLNGKIEYRKYIFNEDEEKTAVKECDKILKENNVSDGHTLFSLEDYIAVNSLFAEEFDDPLNECYYMDYNEDARYDLITDIESSFCEHNWSEKTLEAMAKDLGI